MKPNLASAAASLIVIGVLGLPCALPAGQGAGSQSAALSSLAKLNPIDAHVHIYNQDPALRELVKRLNLRFLNICVVDRRDPDYQTLQPQRSQVLTIYQDTSGSGGFCSTFAAYDFEDSGFSRRVIRQLDEDFSAGAVAVKVYKTIGMEITNRAGNYLMADDSVLDPIYQHIAERGKTVVAHLAEPSSCWEPPNPVSPDYQYYQTHPNEYAWLHPEYPSKKAILAARDHILARYPRLRLVGAHLGSMETNVADIAVRFDRYPNFAVDTAARIPYLMRMPREEVRAFLIQYQDRVLYGTDFEFRPKENSDRALRDWTATLERDWNYFSSSKTIQLEGRSIQGLDLPKKVLRKLYHDNAVRWIPGIQRSAEPSD